MDFLHLFENAVWGAIYLWLGLCVYVVAETAYNVIWDFLADCLTKRRA